MTQWWNNCCWFREIHSLNFPVVIIICDLYWISSIAWFQLQKYYYFYCVFLLRIVNSSAVCFLTPSSYVEYHPENLGNSNFFRSHCVKMSKYWLSLTRTFPYKVNFGVSKILFLYGKLRVRENPYLGKLYAVLYELTLLQKLAPNLQKHLDQKTPLSIVVRSQRTRKLVHNSSS